ncbi:hypothetical protein [Ligilactobacillus equi]|uniref:Uncharacterized protein n=1 Tax=Ligilactobacillus equi DSM 15833 = JCM 10991 TaxID=1423740 RepID=A0A0R1TKS2_9LACO|nr:hypothetical protein [Ligilactobacillus equi]KRL81792.1 hypothetical protein FC36_GL001386 [Ligilactobacillus equi DSM 15833 = JCM 10991]
MNFIEPGTKVKVITDKNTPDERIYVGWVISHYPLDDRHGNIQITFRDNGRCAGIEYNEGVEVIG